MRESKFIKIQQRGEGLVHNKPYYEVINKRGDYVLGDIYYFDAWRQYVFVPVADSEYNHECLSVISDWLKELN